MILSKFNHELLKKEYEKNICDLRNKNFKLKKENNILNYTILVELLVSGFLLICGSKIVSLIILLISIPTITKRLINRKKINDNKLEILKTKNLIRDEEYYIEEDKKNDVIYIDNSIITKADTINITSKFEIYKEKPKTLTKAKKN